MTDKRTWRNLYSRVRWQRLREAQLAEHPLCAYCLRREIVTEATVVDHVIPHKGNEALFFDSTNLASLCVTCHNRDKKLEEHSKTVIYFGVDGYPI